MTIFKTFNRIRVPNTMSQLVAFGDLFIIPEWKSGEVEYFKIFNCPNIFEVHLQRGIMKRNEKWIIFALQKFCTDGKNYFNLSHRPTAPPTIHITNHSLLQTKYYLRELCRNEMKRENCEKSKCSAIATTMDHQAERCSK